VLGGARRRGGGGGGAVRKARQDMSMLQDRVCVQGETISGTRFASGALRLEKANQSVVVNEGKRLDEARRKKKCLRAALGGFRRGLGRTQTNKADKTEQAHNCIGKVEW